MEKHLKVFIAGSKVLVDQRKSFRAILMQLQTLWKINIEAKTFEDFSSSLYDGGGRQNEYNNYIANDADIVVFVFDKKVGDITLQEFDVAYDSYQNTKHPEIYVFCKENGIDETSDIVRLKDKLKELKQYYIPYVDIPDLEILFEKCISRFVIDKFIHKKSVQDGHGWLSKTRNRLKAYFVNYKRRSPIVNFFLYTLEICAVIGFLWSIPGFLRSLFLLDTPGWTFIDAYGKGFIPGLLICATVLYCNAKVLKWKMEGVWLIPIFLFAITLPTLWNEFLEYLIFSVIILVSYGLYICVLNIPHNGHRTIEMCYDTTTYSVLVKTLNKSLTIIWIITLSAWPLMMSKMSGFKETSYSIGMCCIDARFNESPVYSHALAKRLALDGNWPAAKEWYRYSIYKANNMYLPEIYQRLGTYDDIEDEYKVDEYIQRLGYICNETKNGYFEIPDIDGKCYAREYH